MKAIRFSMLSMFLAAIAFAQGATVVTKEGTGEFAVVGKDEVGAVEEAKKLALRNAVEQAAGVRIDSDSVVVNNQLVRDQVLANTSGYVKSYDIKSKSVEKGVAKVVVKAEVITDNLDKDIKAAQSLVKRMGSPSVVVVIQEQTKPVGDHEVYSSDTMSKFINEELAKDGWKILDPAGIDKDFKLGAGIASGNAQVVKNVGAMTKAKFVVYGQATFRHQDDTLFHKDDFLADGGVIRTIHTFAVTGEYGLNVFSTDTGEQVGRLTDSLNWATSKGPMGLSYETSTKAVLTSNKAKFVGQLRAALLEYLRNIQANGTDVSVSVNGLESITAVSEFQKAVATISGVRDAVFQNDFKKGSASYQVKFAGDSMELAQALEAATFKKRKLTVTGSTQNTVEVAIGK